MVRWPPRVAAAFTIVLTTLAVHPAAAWEIHDPIHHDCHERISQAALRIAGYIAPPPPLSGDDARLPGNVEFPTDSYDPNIYALSLIIGARWPDEHGGPDFSFYQQAIAANAPDDQPAHCLRSEGDDGTAGDARAVAECRTAIAEMVWRALTSLDDAGNVSPDARTSATFFTAYQGTIDYPLNEFYFFAGRALHALQDSFAHTFRTSDMRRIVHVMNWVDQVRCTLDEPRDGHGHETVLDRCEDGDPSMSPRLAAATLASTELMQVLSTPGTRSERHDRLDAFLDRWLKYEPGCDYDNAYCGDASYSWLATSDRSDIEICDGLFGCASAASATPFHATALLGLAGLMLLGVTLRRRRRTIGALGVLLVVLLHATTARADADGRGWHAEARTSLSVENPAYAFGAAGMYGWSRADLGAFIELNPWYSIERNSMSLGATNFGVQAHYLHPLRSDLRLRFGAGLGFSRLNSDMIGTNAGKLGVYANVRLLGLVWQWSELTALTIDPLDIALPAPQLTGWPILYTQHRASVGLQLWF
jgi:hypothetical protein